MVSTPQTNVRRARYPSNTDVPRQTREEGILNDATLRNLTPHVVRIFCLAGGWFEVAPEPEPARVAVQRTSVGVATSPLGCAINLVNISVLSLPRLPEPEPSTLLIVSRLVAEAFPGRLDLAVPADLVRDAAGIIIGCRDLAVNQPTRPRDAASFFRNLAPEIESLNLCQYPSWVRPE
jgi:hypothetical protein